MPAQAVPPRHRTTADAPPITNGIPTPPPPAAPASIESHLRHTQPSGTVPAAAVHHPGVVLGPPDFTDDFRTPKRAAILASPLEPPDQPTRRLIRYDLLAGAALLLALLALVPLLLLRTDPGETSTSPKVPPTSGPDSDAVRIELAEPTDLRDKVQLTWKATRDLDFAVIVAEEGKEAETHPVQRKHSLTVDVDPELQYCFMVQASDGRQVYESEPRPLRGAVCQK